MKIWWFSEKQQIKKNKTIWILAEKHNNMFGTELSSLEQKSTLKHIYGNYLPVHFNLCVIHDNIHNVVDPQR